MNRRSVKKAFVFVMAAIMTMGFLPAQAEAASGGSDKVYTINLGKKGVFAGIISPTDAAEWDGSRVYFGTFQEEPILWRILDKRIRTADSAGVMLLQSDSIVADMAFDADGLLNEDQAVLSDWMGSDIRAWLNGTDGGQFLESFGGMEKSSLYIYGKEEAPSTEGGSGESFTNPALMQDKVFLLSAEEALSGSYGYSTPESRILKYRDETALAWWLRSALSGEGGAAVINEEGELAGREILPEDLEAPENPGGAKAGIAPAVYLDTTGILFITPAVNGKPDSLEKVEEAAEVKEWKLTLKAGNTGLSAALAGITNEYERNSTVRLHHQAASSLENATQVSAIIMDSRGIPVYYGRINEDTEASESQFTVPSDIASGSYKLYVFAEEINGNNYTDYAGALGKAVNIIISQMETPKVTTLPAAEAIIYGQKLGESVLNGGEAYSGSTQVPGYFRWVDSFVVPQVSDSESTGYRVQFIPQDSVKYNPVTVPLTLSVKTAQNPPNMPETDITVEYLSAKVVQVSLPDGWSWQEEDKEKEIPAGGQLRALALYKDDKNYDNAAVTVTIRRVTCTHGYGTQVRDAKAAACAEDGYTGDVYCVDCNQKLAEGKTIAGLGHSYKEAVTKQPTVEKEGSKTFTCTVCGHEYSESIPRHKHYYNNEKTIRWLGCEQQGEIKHSCGCGDSYVVVTPALGHDFTEEITVQATSVREGIRTFTCSRCGHKYTESIPKLSSGGNNPGSGAGSTGDVSDSKPYIKGSSSISGWPDINRAIDKANKGDTLQINMNNVRILPKKTLEAMKGKDITLILDLGNDIQWVINGKEITGQNLGDINLKLTKNSNTIPFEVVEEYAGDRSTMQFSLVHEGEFGCTATLRILVSSHRAGYYANLFYYNREAGVLEYVGSSQMDEKGIADLTMTHASDYLIIVDTVLLDGSITAESPSEPPGEEPVEVTISDVNSSPSSISATKGIPPVMIIVVAAVVMGACLVLGIYLHRKTRGNNRSENLEYNR